MSGISALAYFQTKELAAAAYQAAASKLRSLRGYQNGGRTTLFGLTKPSDDLACFSLSLVEPRKISRWDMVGGSPFGIRVTEVWAWVWVWVWRNDLLFYPLKETILVFIKDDA